MKTQHATKNRIEITMYAMSAILSSLRIHQNNLMALLAQKAREPRLSVWKPAPSATHDHHRMFRYESHQRFFPVSAVDDAYVCIHANRKGHFTDLVLGESHRNVRARQWQRKWNHPHHDDLNRCIKSFCQSCRGPESRFRFFRIGEYDRYRQWRRLLRGSLPSPEWHRHDLKVGREPSRRHKEGVRISLERGEH